MTDTPDFSGRDRHFINKAIAARVLKKVPVLPLEQRPKAILIACGDFVHAEDKLGHVWERLTVPHMVCANGGGYLLDGLSPVNRNPNLVPYVVHQIVQTIEIKAATGTVIDQIYDMGDHLCGATGRHRQPIQFWIKSQMEGKRFIKECLRDFFRRNFKVALLFYDPEGEGGPRTWFYEGKEMTRFIAQYQENPEFEFVRVA